MRVRETIHHGNYYNVREQMVEPTFAGIVKLLQASPYNGGGTLEQYAANQYVTKMAGNLLIKGDGQYGWARYRVLQENEGI